jgi:hypothetical protein
VALFFCCLSSPFSLPWPRFSEIFYSILHIYIHPQIQQQEPLPRILSISICKPCPLCQGITTQASPPFRVTTRCGPLDEIRPIPLLPPPGGPRGSLALWPSFWHARSHIGPSQPHADSQTGSQIRFRSRIKMCRASSSRLLAVWMGASWAAGRSIWGAF